jgi:FtsZ-binding cell division protein ZapB
MIAETFNELRIEFDAVIEYANCSENLAHRKALVTEARNVLNQAKNVWQEELKSLRIMLRSLEDADGQRVRLMTHRQNPSNRL